MLYLSIYLFFMPILNMLKTSKKIAFTLVELIVVITILAILWTIALISLEWYTSDARDSVRVTDLKNIKWSLDREYVVSGQYLLPDNATEVTFSWALLWTQWTY